MTSIRTRSAGLVEAGWGLQLATYASLLLLVGTVLELVAARGAAPEARPEAEAPAA